MSAFFPQPDDSSRDQLHPESSIAFKSISSLYPVSENHSVRPLEMRLELRSNNTNESNSGLERDRGVEGGGRGGGRGGGGGEREIEEKAREVKERWEGRRKKGRK